MSKTGPCRIPIFGSRIPQTHSRPKPPEITTKQIGKKVRVGEKEGILRFLGNVHFSKGVWCGIELKSAIGKNDGTVNGVRYFACADRHGLMAPLSKVLLIEGSCESVNDDVSGPYSMLFIEPKLNLTTIIDNPKDGAKENDELDRTVIVNTLGNYKNPISKKNASETFNLSQKRLFEDKLNETIIIKEAADNCTFETKAKPKLDETTININEQNETYTACRKNTYELKALAESITTAVNSCNFEATSDKTKIFETEQIDVTLTDNTLTQAPLNESCENILNDSIVEVKRRKTSTPKKPKIDSLILKNLPDSIDKPSSLPQLRSNLNFASPSQISNKFSYSTPVRGEFTEALLRKLRISSIGCGSDTNTNYDEDSSKRDSLEFEESLGILTPDQMLDGMSFAQTQTRSPSLEYEINAGEFSSRNQNSKKSELPSPKDSSLGILDEHFLNFTVQNSKEFTLDVPSSKENKESELPSPNLNSMTEYSLGIIDEHVLSNIALKTDTTMNMELPLDSVDKSKEFTLTRLEQTPSPEELPLDPTPIIIESDTKTEPTKSKTTNSFITSITSITSLDTGYQGDGEMSRPASRGADNSPLTRRPLPRPQPRHPDPMTDSDFYTESDADNHEDNQLRGDRKAQVIDGTLYGVDPQAAADIYVNNRENMDSSGIFTDLETNTRNEEDIAPKEVPDVSPSDTSSKTVSENSQSNLHEILENKKDKDTDKVFPKDNPKKRNASSPGMSSPSSLSSPRHGAKEENCAKKYKMPKREADSKIKMMIEPSQVKQIEKKTLKKPVGRWDAVMNKISKNDQKKTNLKEVKSKVFQNVNVNTSNIQRQNEIRKQNTRQMGNQKSPNNKNVTTPNRTADVKRKSPGDRNLFSPDRISIRKSPRITITPTRRPEFKSLSPMSEGRRLRTRTSASNTPKNAGSNVGSSIHSSLSDLSGATIPPKKIIGSTKKQREVVQVTQVLTASKLSPRTQQQHTAAENKKNATLHPISSNDAKAKRNIFSPKEKKQIATKGGSLSSTFTPTSSGKFRLEAEGVRLSYRQLEETLTQERITQAGTIEEERKRCQNDITKLIESHRNQISQLKNQHAKLEQSLISEKENAQNNLCKQHEEQLLNLRKEFEKLQRTHEESLDILREENESIREQIDEKRLEIEMANHESMKLKKDYESKEIALKEQNQKLQQQITKEKGNFEEKFREILEENKRLREENERLLSYGDDKDIGIQEVQSLRAVLELKQKEVGELRKALAEATQKADILVGAEERARLLNARCEDFQLQLQRKSEYEQG